MISDHAAGKRAEQYYSDDDGDADFSPHSTRKRLAPHAHQAEPPLHENDEDDDYEDDEKGAHEHSEDEEGEDDEHEEASDTPEDEEDGKERFDRALLEARLLREYRAGEQEDESDLGRFDSLKLAGVIAAFFIVLAAGAFYAAKLIGGGEEKAPLIHADDSPVRVKPAEPGGFFVDHQDKSVYEAMSGKSPEKLPQVQKILPETELPANISEDSAETAENQAQDEAAPEVIAGETNYKQEGSAARPYAEEPPMTGAQGAPANAEGERQDGEAASGEEQAEAPKEGGAQGGMGDFIERKNAEYQAFEKNTKGVPMWRPKPSYDPVLNVALQGPDRVVRSPSEVKLPATGKPKTEGDLPLSSADLGAPTVHDSRILKKTSDGYYLQIGAFRTTSDADRHMKKTLGAYPGLLKDNGVNYYFQPVDLAGNGTLYRLKIGSYPNEHKARKACEELTHKNIECLYARN